MDIVLRRFEIYGGIAEHETLEYRLPVAGHRPIAQETQHCSLQEGGTLGTATTHAPGTVQQPQPSSVPQGVSPVQLMDFLEAPLPDHEEYIQEMQQEDMQACLAYLKKAAPADGLSARR